MTQTTRSDFRRILLDFSAVEEDGAAPKAPVEKKWRKMAMSQANWGWRETWSLILISISTNNE